MKRRSLMTANVLAILIVLDVSLMMLGFHLLGGRDVVQSLGPTQPVELSSDYLTDQLGERHYLPGWESIKGSRFNYQGKMFWLGADGQLWILSDVPPTPAPTKPALGGPLRKLPDGTWAYRPESGATWDDLTQAERDILRMPALCPSSWYNDYATAGTLCPEAIEFMANYDQYRADFEADYYRRYGQ